MSIRIKKGIGNSGSDGGGGIVYTETIFEGNIGAILDVSPLSLSNAIAIERNGQKIYKSSDGETRDYTISGSVITFTIPLVATDRISVISSNIAPIDLSAYMLKSTIVTDGDNTGLAVAGNTIYKFGTVLTSLTISSVETSDYESIIYFTTGAGTIQFTAPNTIKWGGGNEQPQLEPNTVYCIAIRNGLAEIDNFGSAS